MKFREIFRFELAYQVRRPWPWLIFAALLVVAFLITRDSAVADALYADFFVNSPFSIAITTVVGTLMWLMVAAVIAGEAAARDVATGIHPLTWTSSVTKAEYLGGRFLAAFVLNALLLLAVQAGIVAAIYSPGVNAALIGPFRPAGYLTAYAFISLPNAFFATAIQFALSARSGRPMTSYLGSLFLFFMGFFVASFLLFRRGLGTLLDPIGIRFLVEDVAHLWTTIEKNSRLLALEGVVLSNRLVWLGVGLAVCALTYSRFRFAHRGESTRWWRWRRRQRDAQSPTPAPFGITASVPVVVPQVSRDFGAIEARKTISIAWDSFRSIAKSWAGLALLVFVPLLTLAVVLDQMIAMGVPMIPTTALVISELTGPLTAELSRWLIIPLFIIFFAGELVWRERETGIGEVTDAMPGSEWAPLLGKFLGLGLVLAAFTALQMAGGILAQTILDYRNFEFALYLKILFGLQLSEYLLFALLAFVVHVVVDQKYIGHLVAVLTYAFINTLATKLGIEHNLLVYGGGPEWSYTEMRGFGSSLAPWLWFKLYWASWALLLAVVARLLWVRGKERRLRLRLQLARGRFTRPTAMTAAAAVALILTLGGFIFYNTNVLNAYVSSSKVAEWRAEYERRYKKYERIPQPGTTATRLHVEIFPDRCEAEIRGTYTLLNGSDVAIDTIHVTTVPAADTEALAFDRPSRLILSDVTRGYRIFDLEKPLAPGDSLRLDFKVHIRTRGFGNSSADDLVVANGTFFTNDMCLPAIGYQHMRELMTPRERREHGLADRPVIPSLYDAKARMTNTVRTTFEAVLATNEEQVAVAPGALRRAWTEGRRRYFHYATDGAIGNEYAFFSARYAVREARWNDVAIRLFHHPTHITNVDRLIRSIRASLDSYTREFGPYPFSHLTVVEIRGNEIGMHADSSLIRFSEGTALWNPGESPRSLDLPFAIMAHEVSHQWWGSQLIPAFVEGAPVMSESLAGYSALGVVEENLGREQLQRFLSFMRQPYPYAPINRGEPLLRGLDPYISYRKGPFALYALTQYIGKEPVNATLRRLLETHRPGKVPLVTTLDLYRELQAATPDSAKDLLRDLFEVNTIWQFRSERSTAVKTDAGTWQVTIDVRARKVVVDEAGVETEVPMDEWVEAGVFGHAEKDHAALSAPLYVQKHRLRSGHQTITVTVPREPVLAGIDPHHLLDWEEREDDDNIERVEIKE